MEVLSGWGMDTDSRLYFRKNYAKYEFFRKPLVSLWRNVACIWWWAHTYHFTFGILSLWTSPICVPTTVWDEEFKDCCNNWCRFNICRTFSRITWSLYPVKPMGWWITLSLYRYQVRSVYRPLFALECQLWGSQPLSQQQQSMDKHFSTQHRPFSTPAPVQRYMDTSMPKSKAGSLGRSFTLCCGGQGFISPTRELPRSVKQSDLSTVCCMRFRKIKSYIKSRLIHGLFVAFN